MAFIVYTCNFFFFQECGKFEACAGRGLHAHHPRDCLFFLRDFDVEELQQFLQEKNVEFDTEPPKEQVEAAKREKQKQREEEAVAANGMFYVQCSYRGVKVACTLVIKQLLYKVMTL